MNSAYRDALRLACWVASIGVADYDKDDIEFMVGEVGKETATHFYEFYGRKYGADVNRQLVWIEECDDE
jgi:hypothetical protein